MFGWKTEMEQRIRMLEVEVSDLKQDRLCKYGQHKWETVTKFRIIPYMRCSHCYTLEPKQKEITNGI